jgi:hypothetical protein
MATEMKQFAKREPRSSYAVDRRRPDGTTPDPNEP